MLLHSGRTGSLSTTNTSYLAAAMSDCILEGLPTAPLPECSLAEYLVPKMRALPEDLVIQVDSDRGVGQTVEELLDMSIRLSEGLKKIGLKENDVVGMRCRNCFEASAVVLGTWLSGAVIAPISDAKVAEMKHIFELVKPKFFFCEENAAGAVAEAIKLLSLPCSIVLADTDENKSYPHMTFRDVLIDVDTNSYKPFPVASPATQPVTILFSSGTSGLPKGVQITHRNLIFQDFNMKTVFDATDIGRCLQLSCFFWVTGVLMFLRSLTTGICRILMREATPENIFNAIQRYKTNWTLTAPSLALTLIDHPEFDSFDLSSMKKLFIGGTTITAAMINKIKAKWKNLELIIPYGSTEVSGMVSITEGADDLSSVGRVTLGVKVKIVDTSTGEALRAKVTGEICVLSPGVMKGYVGNEKATLEAIDSEGWCHTGDLGYYDEAGRIYIVDRIKEMIKIRNLQVSPTEVEDVILAIPGVSEVAVVGVTPDETFYEIMALVVRTEESTITEEDIHARISDNLSEYKRLTAGVRFVESLPKTTTGKLRRKEIRSLAQVLYSGSSG